MFTADYNTKTTPQGMSRKRSIVRKSLLMALSLAIYSPSSTNAADIEDLKMQKAIFLHDLEETSLKIESFKNDLHFNQVIIKAKDLIELEDKFIHLQGGLEDIDEKIHNGDFPNIRYMFREAKKKTVVGPTLESIQLKYNIVRENLEAYFAIRQDINGEIVTKIDQLLGTLKTERAKNYLLSVKAIIKNNNNTLFEEKKRTIIVLNDTSILETQLKENDHNIGESTSKQFIKNKLIKTDLNEKIFVCEEILNQQDKFSLVWPIINSIKRSSLPTDFLSENFLQDLNKILEFYKNIFKNELNYFFNDMDRNEINMVISQLFLSIHDKAQDLHIQVGDRKQMTMASMHFANKYLNSDHINSKYFDENSALDFDRLYNVVAPFEGKYVTWHLNRGFDFYNTVLFVTPQINQIALNFYNFSQDILTSFKDQPVGKMISMLRNSKKFKNPIVMGSESVWVHDSQPYVVRIKRDKPIQYSIGLLEYNFIDESFFDKNTMPYTKNAYNRDYWNTYNLYGDHYKLSNYTHATKIYPTICDPQNEILKYSSLGSYGTFIPANWIWENKRINNPELKLVSEWEYNTLDDTKKDLMARAHLK